MSRRVHAVRFSAEELERLRAALPVARVKASRKEPVTVAVLIREGALLVAELLTTNTAETPRADLARQVYNVMLGGTLLDTSERD